MRKKHFKFGLLLLVGLVGYFLTLSAVLVASAGMREGDNANGTRAAHVGKEIAKKLAKNDRFDGKSSSGKTGLPVTGPGGSAIPPCHASQACTPVYPGEIGLTGGNWQSANSPASGSNGGWAGAHGFSYPAALGWPFNNGGGAFGTVPGFGANNRPSSGDEDPDQPKKDETPLGFLGPDPEILFDKPDAPPPPTRDGEMPPLDATAPVPVPEPSTFWVLLASLTALVMVPGSIRRTLRERLGQKRRPQ
jgi:hypothetical protein